MDIAYGSKAWIGVLRFAGSSLTAGGMFSWYGPLASLSLHIASMASVKQCMFHPVDNQGQGLVNSSQILRGLRKAKKISRVVSHETEPGNGKPAFRQNISFALCYQESDFDIQGGSGKPVPAGTVNSQKWVKMVFYTHIKFTKILNRPGPYGRLRADRVNSDPYPSRRSGSL